MKKTAVNPKNETLARKLRALVAGLDDPELRGKVERVALIVERAEREAPRSLLNLVFRKPTTAEKRRGSGLEDMARKILSGHGRVVA